MRSPPPGVAARHQGHPLALTVCGAREGCGTRRAGRRVGLDRGGRRCAIRRPPARSSCGLGGGGRGRGVDHAGHAGLGVPRHRALEGQPFLRHGELELDGRADCSNDRVAVAEGDVVLERAVVDEAAFVGAWFGDNLGRGECELGGVELDGVARFVRRFTRWCRAAITTAEQGGCARRIGTVIGAGDEDAGEHRHGGESGTGTSRHRGSSLKSVTSMRPSLPSTIHSCQGRTSCRPWRSPQPVAQARNQSTRPSAAGRLRATCCRVSARRPSGSPPSRR